MSDTNLGSMFWAAAQGAPAPTTGEAPKTSSCCGPKPAAETASPGKEPGTAKEAAAPKQSSCCGPKPAAQSAQAPAKSSCCGPKPAAEKAETAESAQPVKKSSCCG